MNLWILTRAASGLSECEIKPENSDCRKAEHCELTSEEKESTADTSILLGHF